MDSVLLILSVVLSLIGIVGCIVPGMPGPPFNFVALILVQASIGGFQLYTLIICGVLTTIILILDYTLPVWFAKKYGATKQGIIGSVIGMIVGAFFTPVGMILGLLAGAILGDLIAGRSSSDATRSGVATFLGTLFATGLKLALSGVMTTLVIYEIIKHLL